MLLRAVLIPLDLAMPPVSMLENGLQSFGADSRTNQGHNQQQHPPGSINENPREISHNVLLIPGSRTCFVSICKLLE